MHPRARLVDAALRRPWLILLACGVITAATLIRLVDVGSLRPRLDIDPSIDALLPRGGEARGVYERVRERFESDDVLLVAWLGEDLFTPDRLAAFKRLARHIERLPGVRKVEGLPSSQNLRVHDDYTTTAPFLATVPADRAAAERIRDEARGNPLYAGQLIATDSPAVMLAVRFDADLAAHTLIELVARIAELDAAEAGTLEHFLSGPLYVRLEISRLLLRDLYHVMPLAIAVTLLIAACGFRTLRGAVLPCAANVLALAGTLALFVAAGQSLNYVTVILPPTVYVVGFAYAIHVISDFEDRFAGGMAQAAAVSAAVSHVLLPVSLSALTTVIGFASLMLSDIESIAVFGRYAATGTLFAWIAALTLVPAGLLIVPLRARPPRVVSSTIARRLAEWAMRHQRAMVVTSGIAAALAAVLATHIEVDTNYLENFATDTSLHRNFERIGEVFAGPVPLQILVEGTTPDTFKTPSALREVAALQAWLAAQPEIGGVYSLVDYIDVLVRALAPEQAADSGVPQSARLVDHVLMLGSSDEVRRYADKRYASTLLHVRTHATSSRDLNALAARIEARLAELPAPLHGQVTGSSYLIAQTLDDVTHGQITSLLTALLLIYVVMIGLFGSFKVAAIAMVPNVLPIMALFAILGAGPLSLTLTTSLVASITLGIAVDDSIHFVARFRAEARRASSRHAAVGATLVGILRPVTLNTYGLCLGFLTMLAGELQSQREFGALAAAVLFIAWILDLSLTPALCGRYAFRAAGAA